MVSEPRNAPDADQFACLTAHELQAPLRWIAISANNLERDHTGAMGPDARECVRIIREKAAEMRSLLDDLLSLARVGGAPRALGLIEPAESFRAAVRSLDALIKDLRVEVGGEDLPPACGDRRLLTLVFRNLIENAIKYRRAEPPRVSVRGWKSGQRCVFAVEDNGIGIEARHFDRIFDPFGKLHGADRYPGNGLGLAICRKIVEQQGGTIWVESTVGKGSVFYFTLPAVSL